MKKLIFLQMLSMIFLIGQAEAQNLIPISVSGNLSQIANTINLAKLAQVGVRNKIYTDLDSRTQPILVVHIPMDYCEALPVYYYYRKADDMGFEADELYFFADESKRKITADVGCAKYEVAFALTPDIFASTSAEYRGQEGLILPQLEDFIPFSQSSSLSHANLKRTSSGSVMISTDHAGVNDSLEVNIYRESEPGRWDLLK